MASLKRFDADPKASSLPDSATAHRPVSSNSGKTGGEGKRAMGRRGTRGWVTLVVDIILLLVIAGLTVGGVFAYRAIRELYAPTWETREVVFEVEMTGIDLDLVKYGQDGRPTMTGHPLWSSDRSDTDFLGTVTDVRTVLVSEEGGKNTLNLYLTVEATAHYREGKGYRMGATMLLAGMKNTFMAEGLVAEGTVISMHEKSDETAAATEGGTVFAEPDGVDPDARG
jgi:hypothetical protein